MINAPVLVLNQNYQPLNVCTARRAIVLLSNDKAELLESGLGAIRTPFHAIPTPSVIRLMYLIKRPILKRRLSRKEVFIRDNYACLYCGRETKQLTVDHVMPRFRGGTHSWDNVVSACISCNHRKAGRTPQEAGMNLPREARPPRANPYSLFTNKPLQDGWYKFIPWISKSHRIGLR